MLSPEDQKKLFAEYYIESGIDYESIPAQFQKTVDEIRNKGKKKVKKVKKLKKLKNLNSKKYSKCILIFFAYFEIRVLIIFQQNQLHW